MRGFAMRLMRFVFCAACPVFLGALLAAAVTSMLSAGTYGHGGAFGTQARADPKRDLFVILLIQRTGLSNADGFQMRREFQRLAVDAVKP